MNEPLLAADEPPAYEVIDGVGPVILVCDHASNRIPRALGSLGLEPRRLEEHIAWDIGAGAVTRDLAARLGAAAVVAGYSRLVVDLNRSPRDATAMPRISDGVLIPGNVGMTAVDRERRLAGLFVPYHAAIDALIEGRTTAEHRPVVVGIHSFTPHVHRHARRWQIGVLWDQDPRLALPLIAALRAVGGIVVGDNEPYSGRHPADYTIDTHAEARRLAHAGIELRQDLVADAAGQARFARILGDVLERTLADHGLYRAL